MRGKPYLMHHRRCPAIIRTHLVPTSGPFCFCRCLKRIPHGTERQLWFEAHSGFLWVSFEAIQRVSINESLIKHFLLQNSPAAHPARFKSIVSGLLSTGSDHLNRAYPQLTVNSSCLICPNLASLKLRALCFHSLPEHIL